ncbi:MAG: YraN family protein [Pseudomonadota bacterium]
MPQKTSRSEDPAVLTSLKARSAALLGSGSEQRAETHLRQQGLVPICRNWRCPLGELDLVMRDGETLVIVEVRARSTQSHGGALASVDAKKRGRLMRTALAFVQAHDEWQDASIRFDIISFEADGRGRWLKNAFDSNDYAV